jgi:hypothetical protein
MGISKNTFFTTESTENTEIIILINFFDRLKNIKQRSNRIKILCIPIIQKNCSKNLFSVSSVVKNELLEEIPRYWNVRFSDGCPDRN